MNKIPVAALLTDFRRMLDEHWRYGSDTRTGQVDCSGAFVWAYRQHGRDIYHGSNRMAREEVEALIPIGSATVVPGMAAFKRRDPDKPGYSLPASYKPGGAHFNGDLGDYYHVGLIDEDTSRVLNAQSAATGFVSSPVTQNWSHVAYLKQVDYGPKEDIPMTTLTVHADNGKPVNLRKAPSTTAARLTQLPVGTPVTLLAEEGDWARVNASGKVGYMMKAYLSGDPIEERLTRLEARVAALEGGGDA